MSNPTFKIHDSMEQLVKEELPPSLLKAIEKKPVKLSWKVECLLCLLLGILLLFLTVFYLTLAVEEDAKTPQQKTEAKA